ncbi:transglutaminase family protein [soil metagenome]
MIYDIRHITRFDYAGSVQFARCNLRLKPIAWAGQELLDYRMVISPSGRTFPARAEAGLAHVMRLVVEDPVKFLSIDSISRIAVDRPAPVPSATDPTLAEVAAAARVSRDLSAAGPAAYLFPSPRIVLDQDITDWCALDLKPDRPVLEAGMALCQRIRREFKFDSEATLIDTSPHEAFVKRGGVCQDFAQIMITGLRGAGLPAAYAAGYIRTIPPPGKTRLVGADATHAWALLWCGPAIGWVGLDPTNGIWMANDHIIMAIGRDYGDIAPIDGIVLGASAQKLDVSVDVAPEMEEAAA